MKALTALWLFGWWYQIQWQYWTWSWPVIILLALWLIGSIGLYRVVRWLVIELQQPISKQPKQPL